MGNCIGKEDKKLKEKNYYYDNKSTNNTNTNNNNNHISNDFKQQQQQQQQQQAQFINKSQTSISNINNNGINTNQIITNVNSNNNTTSSNSSNANLYIALYDYDARTTDDLSFKKGDILDVFDNKANSAWWLARHYNTTATSGGSGTSGGTSSKRYGFIPRQFVAKLESIESKSWYFGNIKRNEAEKLLLQDTNKHGSYLIRISDQGGTNHAYSLSVRDYNTVKHYRIRQLEEDGSFFIARRVIFKTLDELVDYYKSNADGLVVELLQPCSKQTTQPITDGLTHELVDKYEVDRNLFQIIRKCGQGQFGDVFYAIYNQSVPVAIKMLKPNCMNKNEFLAEAALMKQLKHKKLMQLYALCTKQEPIYIVTEFMKNGSLIEYLQTPKGKRLEFDALVDIASQIADGMAYLESKNFIHRDLAARNILVGENNDVKIADFGLARFIKEQQDGIYAAKEGTKLPIKWSSPEAVLYNQFSVKSDVWSFGILLTEVVTYGRIPYPGMTNAEVLEQVAKGYRMPIPPNCPKHFYELMLKCWNAKPEDRPTFEALKYTLENYFETDETQYKDASIH